MIGILTATPAVAVAFAKHLHESLRGSAGPFYSWTGSIDGEEALLLLAPEDGGANGTWAAAKLLLRRGAGRLVQIHPAQVAPAAQERHGWEMGDFIPPAHLADGSGLEPLLNALPDTARALPAGMEKIEIPASIRNAADEDEGGGASLGGLTLVRSLRCVWMANHLSRAHRFAFFDRWSIGAAEASKEEDRPLTTLLVASELVRANASIPAPPVMLELALERAVAELAGK